MFYIEKTAIDYLPQPQGVTGHPQFLWIMKSDKQNVKQTAYRLQIGKEGDFHTPVYDSQKVESEQSAQISPEDFEMETLTSYSVRVKVWNNLGEESEWSAPAVFLSALKNVEEWKADFISAETEKKDKMDSRGTYIRGKFHVTKKIKNGYLVSTALGLYHPYLNGVKVGDESCSSRNRGRSCCPGI